jgi:hypothetical protein
MKYTFTSTYYETLCHKDYNDAYVYVDGVPFCWNCFLNHVNITDKSKLKTALQRLYNIESTKFENFVKKGGYDYGTKKDYKKI